ncbi:MAG: hypothetical protein JNG89_17550 [Planctomycetaceae bacterium]|nr:hypothetical protein [Planctomycetaceae bacterium]
MLLLLAGGALAPETAIAQGRRSRRTAPADTPPEPRLYTSRNFKVMTDLPPNEAEELLQRLETMIKLVSAYFGRPNVQPIEMFVFDDFSHWNESQLAQLAPEGVAMVRGGGGLTMSTTLRVGTDMATRSIVYAGADHGTPQHEAVHAYCSQAFNTCGPVWYAEGMAEVGNYWVENDKSVTADPRILEYLKSQDPRPLNDIVNNPLETTGDSWQNYAWRWALCHLLGFNENYTKRFKPLGLALLAGQDANFWEVYGSQSHEIEFEYLQFLENVEPGYRCDLASWDWKTKFQMLRADAQVQAVIRADRGWQASRLRLKAGTSYACKATGKVKLSKDDTESTDGNDGALIGVVMQDYKLSEPFELPVDGTFEAPLDGDLFLRCRDAWGSVGDNSGKLTVRLSLPEESKTATP